MLLHVVHETRYDYSPPVETAQHVTHLKPLDTPYQQLLSHHLDVRPEPASLSESVDVFGNARTFFSLQNAHDELVVVADSLVRTFGRDAPRSDITWDAVREQFRYHAGAGWEAATEFSYASPHVPRHGDFAAYARASFAPGMPLMMAARDLMERIHGDFTYEADSTEVHTPTLEALAQRRGVCQDFAHIMLGCLRAMGLAARYVSGYMLTHPPEGQPRLIGADASHAWVSVYVPGPQGGWWDLDPTNNRPPGEDYVTLALGRDFSDISPMRGVIHGGARHTLSVAVTVAPMDESEAPDAGTEHGNTAQQSQEQS
ncbi:MAG: transglutaminase family protein [Ramlibacter sp.]|nr:transglutaminase family protein [Ramlibacter sp.]